MFADRSFLRGMEFACAMSKGHWAQPAAGKWGKGGQEPGKGGRGSSFKGARASKGEDPNAFSKALAQVLRHDRSIPISGGGWCRWEDLRNAELSL